MAKMISLPPHPNVPRIAKKSSPRFTSRCDVVNMMGVLETNPEDDEGIRLEVHLDSLAKQVPPT